jgi:hypothetical protein
MNESPGYTPTSIESAHAAADTQLRVELRFQLGELRDQLLPLVTIPAPFTGHEPFSSTSIGLGCLTVWAVLAK